MLLEDGEYRHWSTVDLWSDARRGPDRLTSTSGEEEQADEAPEDIRPDPVDLMRITHRSAQLGIDIPRPLTVSTDADDLDLQLQACLRAAEAQRLQFWHLRLGCSFSAPDGGEHMESAVVYVRLLAEDEDELADSPTPRRRGRRHPPAPVAWSMLPEDSWVTKDHSLQYKLGVDAKLLSAEVTGHRGETSTCVVRAHGLLTSEPWWQLGGQGQRLDGNYEFALVVRGPLRTGSVVECLLDTTLVKTRLGRRSLRATVTGSALARADLLTAADYEEFYLEL